jgi:hypothetical protein
MPMCYQLRDKESTKLNISQETSIKIDKNMQALGRSNLLGFTKGSASKQYESKEKLASTESKESSSDSIKYLTKVIKSMESYNARQLNSMKNSLISMEISQANRFHPRTNNERWKRNRPPQDQRPPNQLEATNLVEHEAPPFCRDCNYFYE